jgi:hypothetical protein
MKINRTWLWLGGALAGGGAALALGVPPGTLLVVAAVLACPAMMLFGMRGMHGAGGMAGHSGSQEGVRTERNPTASPPEPPRDEVARRS